MRTWVLSAVCLLALAALAAALPRPLDDPKESTPAQQQTDDLRHKRTIGFLRSYFPSLTEILDRKIQTITRFLFRLIGRLVLGGADNGGGGGGTDASSSGGAGASSSGGAGNGRRISITLPTYPPGLDDEDEEEDEDDNETAASANDVDANATSAGPEEVKNRVVRATAEEPLEAEKEGKEDQDAAADDQDARDKRFLFGFGRQSEEGGQGSGGGSGNFLFDLIRDTATRTARAAGGFYRMVAGTDGEEGDKQAIRYSPWLNGKKDEEPETAASHLSLGLSGKASLIAGSGATEDVNDHATTGPSAPSYYSTGAAAAIAETPEVDAKEDGYTSGIPGPITRLFVIANRGISNLVQDLILRLAQTSERIVNFKARLITSII
ncbi:uncharacterized protein LOC135945993 isoform X1 [Cloeon dipterum]|uniref:uncharacterized protein LOC135945993 isoform X1 n=1 Tax=Cloeon dipterum TaxID=197152 RepID=UPI003220356A